MSADAFIQLRVTPEVKTLLRALAAREQITESALVRQLIETMLRMQVKAGMSLTGILEPRGDRHIGASVGSA